MKMESQKRSEHILFLATENVILHVNQPYKIRQDMIESKNFIPEAFLMHQFHDTKEFAINPITSRLSEGLAQAAFPTVGEPSPLFRKEETSYFSDEDDEDDEEWDEEDDEDWDEDEDEDWDEEDEDWDEDEEDWDEDDEDWSDDEDE